MWLSLLLIGNLLADEGVQVEQMIANGQSKRAVELLTSRADRLANSQLLIPRVDRLRHWLNLGLAWSVLGKLNKAESAWKNALIIDPELAEPTGLNSDASKLWRDLKSQIDAVSSYPLILPENVHFFDHYVDGLLIQTTLSLKKGPHFFQIRCGNGGLRSLLLNWPSPVPWREMCGLPPVALLETSNSALVRDSKDASRRLTGVAFITTGASLLVASGVMHQLWLSPLHGEILNARANPADINRQEANALTASFLNVQMWTSGTMIVGAVIIAIGGGMQWPETTRP